MTDDELYESMARDRDAYPKGTTMTNETKTDEPDLAERITRRLFGPSYLLGKSREGEVRALTAPLEAELAELRAFAERFPKTADGVRIQPHMFIYYAGYEWLPWWVGSVSNRKENIILVRTSKSGRTIKKYANADNLYSTEAAMLAAKEGK